MNLSDSFVSLIGYATIVALAAPLVPAIAANLVNATIQSYYKVAMEYFSVQSKLAEIKNLAHSAETADLTTLKR
jgi:hypothetical protein